MTAGKGFYIQCLHCFLHHIKKLLVILLPFAAGSLAGQNATVRGFVYFKESGEPAIFTTVFIKGTTIATSSDVNGYFSLTRIPPGTHTLMATSIGYDTVSENLILKSNEIITKKLYLGKSVVVLDEVTISAEQSEKTTEVKISVNTITPKEIKQIPTVGGEPDLAQYLQVLPGVVFTGDQGGQLYIRGGSPIQNKVLLDGMVIYNPFHSIGLFSVFDADIIRNADIYTGGYNSEYGGRISSIMDVTTRDGNKKRYGGKVSASPFGAKALFEGPIIKNSDPEKGSTSFILSAKTSYLPTTSKYIYSYIDTAGLPFSFNDYYGKVSLNAANGSKINFFGFNFNDRVRYQALSDFKWDSYGGGSNFVLVPESSPVLVDGVFSYSSYGISMLEGNELTEAQPDPRTSNISGFNMGLNFTYFFGKSNLKYGVEVLGFKTAFDFYNSVNRHITQAQNTTEIAGYFKYKMVSKNEKIVFEPGFRLHYYASLSNMSPEPRFGLKVNASKRLRLKAAGGIYSQNFIGATSDRDVVNLFYGFLSGPDNLQDQLVMPDGSIKDITHKLQKANHLIAGAEYDLFKHIDINVEAYQKTFTQLTNINRNKLFEDSPDNASRPDQVKKDFIIETGYARGADLRVKFDHKQFYFWAVYSLTYVSRWDGVQKYFPHFDRRHNINLVGSVQLGKKRRWEVNARWNFGSGFPFTPTQGFYEKLTFADGINTDYTTANGELGILYGTLNSHRLPSYHRLDLTIKWKKEIRENVTVEIAGGATNIYNRANIFYFDRILYQRVNQLPILPTISFSLSF